mmetsp:Transcript_105958/g.316445  ORF Transcript_105958/g.316445 Transcript_105958/m.316445 type:complete len:281 (-) Transcript_105958:737-1579(-)
MCEGARGSADALVLVKEGAHVLPLLPERKRLLVARVVRQGAVRAFLAEAALPELARHPRALLTPCPSRQHLLHRLGVVGVRPACVGRLLRSFRRLQADLLDGGDVAVPLPSAAFWRLIRGDRSRGPGGALRGLLRGVCHLHGLGGVCGVGRQGGRLLGVLRRLLGHLRQRVQRVGCPARLLSSCHRNRHGVPELLDHRAAHRWLGLVLEHGPDARRHLAHARQHGAAALPPAAHASRRHAAAELLRHRKRSQLVLQSLRPTPEAGRQIVRHGHLVYPESR